MREVKLSSKNRIVIARDVRQALGVKSGDCILVVPGGHAVILLRKPKKYAKAIAGMGRIFMNRITSTRREKAGASH